MRFDSKGESKHLCAAKPIKIQIVAHNALQIYIFICDAIELNIVLIASSTTAWDRYKE
jgi:hypothetical protein